MNLHSLLVTAANAEGFPLAAGLDLDRATDAFAEHVRRYDGWLAAGYSGVMDYLIRGRDRRANPRMVFPKARSVFCVALPYSTVPPGHTDPSLGPRYARYLRGIDYHEDLAARLGRALNSAAAQITEGPSLSWKICVDTSAVLERTWAALSGLGWIGKNTMLIHPKLGSYLFLGVAFLNRELDRDPAPLPNYCGNCVRCLDACPTSAFPQANMLDSTRCISYWTLEKRGELPLTDAQRDGVGTRIAGCDACQEACPFNIKPSRHQEARSTPESSVLAGWRELIDESEDAYRARVRDSALSRVKPAQFSRNLAITLTNVIGAEPALGRELASIIFYRTKAERDLTARAEWERCALTVNQAPARKP